MNVPAYKAGIFWKTLRKLYVMCYAILVPEAVLVWSLRQQAGAAKLKKEFNAALAKLEGDFVTLFHGT